MIGEGLSTLATTAAPRAESSAVSGKRRHSMTCPTDGGRRSDRSIRRLPASAEGQDPGGLGVGEAAGSQLFSEFGLADGGLVVLLIRSGTIVFSIPGVIGVLGRPKMKKEVGEVCL
jgi:hypothetical protein